MLPRKLKLSVENFPKRSAFSFKGNQLSLKAVPNQLGYSRFGVAVGKGVSSKATVRNWVKRAIYKELKERAGEIDPGTDLLAVVARPIIETNLETKEALGKELAEGLRALKMI